MLSFLQTALSRPRPKQRPLDPPPSAHNGTVDADADIDTDTNHGSHDADADDADVRGTSGQEISSFLAGGRTASPTATTTVARNGGNKKERARLSTICEGDEETPTAGADKTTAVETDDNATDDMQDVELGSEAVEQVDLWTYRGGKTRKEMGSWGTSRTGLAG